MIRSESLLVRVLEQGNHIERGASGGFYVSRLMGSPSGKRESILPSLVLDLEERGIIVKGFDDPAAPTKVGEIWTLAPVETEIEDPYAADVRSGENLASHVANNVSSSQAVNNGFVDRMSREHRTIQQNFTRLCVEWFRHLAEMAEKGAGWYDLRNQASVELGREIFEKVDSQFLAIPFI